MAENEPNKRLQARLRGTATRRIEDVDFHFEIPPLRVDARPADLPGGIADPDIDPELILEPRQQEAFEAHLEQRHAHHASVGRDSSPQTPDQSDPSSPMRAQTPRLARMSDEDSPLSLPDAQESRLARSPSAGPSPVHSPPAAPTVRTAPPPPRAKLKRSRTSEEPVPGNVQIKMNKLASGAGGTTHINEIDVVAQLLGETLQKLAKRQDGLARRVLEAFAEELDVWFIEMTDALDANRVLKAAIARAQKRKNQLRQELLSVRQQRSEVAKKVQAIRNTHKQDELQRSEMRAIQRLLEVLQQLPNAPAESTAETNTTLYGIEDQLQRLVPYIAGHWPALARLQHFNAFLSLARGELT